MSNIILLKKLLNFFVRKQELILDGIKYYNSLTYSKINIHNTSFGQMNFHKNYSFQTFCSIYSRFDISITMNDKV